MMLSTRINRRGLPSVLAIAGLLFAVVGNGIEQAIRSENDDFVNKLDLSMLTNSI